MTEFHVVGKALPRVDGIPKVSGSAVYSVDVCRPGLLWGKCARSTHAHAKIVRIDTAAAAAVPGVVAVLTGADLPGVFIGQTLRDQPPLARDVVRFVDEKVAAIAAETAEAAAEAAALVEVEYEELPAVFDPAAAMCAGAPILHPDLASYRGYPRGVPSLPNVHAHQVLTKGDVSIGFAEADRVFDHTFRTPRFHQAYLEPHACVVEVDPDGRVHVWASNKAPFVTRKRLAEALGLQESQVIFHNGPIGGDFGGKGSLFDEPVAYFLARVTGRPVKMAMTSLEEFHAGNPRHAAVFEVRTGVTHDGLICARQVTIYWDSGAYGSHRPLPDVTLAADRRALGPYRIPHTRVESFYVYTNQVPCGHMRSPGSPQVTFAIESQIDMIARALGIDPLEFRCRNGMEEGDLSPYGERYHGVRMKETLQRAVETQQQAPTPPIAGLLRGVGIASCERNIGAGRSTARVEVESNGTVHVMTGAADPGNGTFTMLTQVVAEVFQVDPDHVRISVLDTDLGPWDEGVGASRVTHVTGGATTRAAEALRNRLKNVAADLLEAPSEVVELTPRGFVPQEQPSRIVSLATAAQELIRRAEGPAIEEAEYAVRVPIEHTFATHVAEVDVDPETGQIHLQRLVCAHDTGRILNPLSATGQLHGGAIQGVGHTLMEDLQFEDGRVVNGSFGEYKIPTIRDVPSQLEAVFVEGAPSPQTPFGAKALAEVTSMPILAAIANAVADATGVRVLKLPITAEKVLAGLRENGRSSSNAPTRLGSQ